MILNSNQIGFFFIYLSCSIIFSPLSTLSLSFLNYLLSLLFACVQGSGSNVDLCVVTADKTDYLRGYEEIVAKGPRTGDYRYRQGTTAIIGTPCVRRFEVVSQSVSSVESMETC